MSPSVRCARPGCDGVIVDGYCDTCGMAPARGTVAGPTSAAVAPPVRGAAPVSRTGPAPAAPGGARPTSARSVLGGSALSAPISGRSAPISTASRRASGRTGSTTARRRGFAGGLVDVPDVPVVDPATLVMVDAQVAEGDRFCASCGQPVGRAKGDSPGRLQGFCAQCRHPYDFSPKLQAGDIVAGQYDIVGCLAHGGLGWIYLARDRNVADRFVVLKGILDSGDEQARAAALAERKFLADMEHPAIVKIYNFVAHRGAEYIVMEYVGGKSLKTILKDRRNAAGRVDPLPLDQALAYIIGIVPAFEYLHARGYVYCDFKPDNVIHQGNQLKLIDLGGVRRLGDATGDIYGTVGFQAPEIAEAGPSIVSDVYTIVRTLAVLCLDFRGYTKEHRYGAPDPAEHPVLVEFDSLRRLFERGTAADPAARFESVADLGEQLEGVLREVQAVREGTYRPARSSAFTGDLLALRTHATVDAPDWTLIPSPLVPPTDPAAPFLASLAGLPAEQVPNAIVTAVAAGQVTRSIEVVTRDARALAEARQLPRAVAAVAEANDLEPDSWQTRWAEGCVALASARADDAVAAFDAVTSWMPGELAPRLALAVALETAHRPAGALAFYERIATIDPGWVAASFGAARCASAIGARDRATAALNAIPAGSALRDEALAVQVDLLLRSHPGKLVVLDDLREAEQLVLQLEAVGQRRTALRREVLGHLFELVSQGNARPIAMFGRPGTMRGLRSGLEATYRELAAEATTRAERIALVDMANRVRPRTLL